MRRRHLLLASCLALPVALGALAQAEGERQFDAAVARLRAGMGPDGTIEWASRSIDPVTGRVRLQGVTLRHGTERLMAGEATLENLAPDRVGSAVLNNVRVEAPGTGGTKDPMVATAARVTFSALVLPALAGGPAVDWAAASAEGATLEAVRVETPGVAEAELGRLQLSGYSPGSLREVTAEGFTFTDRTDGVTRARIGRARLAGATVPRVGQPFDPWALAADTALVEGAEMSSERDQVAFRLGRTGFDGWGEGRLSSMSMDGLSIEGDSTTGGRFEAQVGRIAFAGVAVRDIAYAVANNLNPPQGAPGQDQSGSIEGINFTLAGDQVLRIDAIRGLNTWDGTAPGTEIGRLAVENLTLDLPDEFGGEMLDALGYKVIQGGLGVDTRLTRKDGHLVVDPFFIQANGMGRLGLTMDIRGFDVPVPGTPSTDDPFAMMANWSAAGMSLRYADQGLLRTLIAKQAAESNVPERQLRDSYAQMALRTPLPGAGRGREAAGVTRVREAFASFARDLGTIELTIRPPKPVPFLQAVGFVGMPPDQAVRELGLTAKATPPAR